ncbi:sensor histidine kinase [Streptomyces zaomyceticus]|uniref:sensor histidine kinase n=1 Tax=Streptomyces zaomyceticus TaxID=68286 RepID=UPI0037BCF178
MNGWGTALSRRSAWVFRERRGQRGGGTGGPRAKEGSERGGSDAYLALGPAPGPDDTSEGSSDESADDGPAPAIVSVVLVVVILGFSFEPGVLLPRPAAVPMLLLQIVTCLPATRRLRGSWTLAAQILLAPWSGLPGFLGASVLLVVEQRVRWALFAVVVLTGGLLAPGDGGLHSVLNGMGNALAHGLILYALTRLTDLYTELRATRHALARARVVAEREHAGRMLEAALGTALAEIIRLAGQGTRAAAELTAVARVAAERVRAAPPPRSADVADVPARALTPRLAWPIVVATHLEYLVVGAAFLLDDGVTGVRFGVYSAALATVVGLQAYHSLPRAPGVRPRFAAWTLGVQLALALGVLAAPDGPYPQLVAFAAASVLIVLPGRVARPTAAALTTLVAVTALVRTDGPGARGTALLVLDVVLIAVVFYGLALLTALVHQVREARGALAALAVARERRRIARDVHDLLGYGLSGIALKGELAIRDPDPERAAGHLADAAALAGRALSDLRDIPGDGTRLDLHEELNSADELLGAAGVRLRVHGELDSRDGAEALFATVLREAVTNVLRHAPGARWCEVRFGSGTLRVSNDGRAPGPPVREESAAGGGGGNGLRNLRERAEAVGGVLEATPTLDGQSDGSGCGYVLTIRLESASASRPTPVSALVSTPVSTPGSAAGSAADSAPVSASMSTRVTATE